MKFIRRYEDTVHDQTQEKHPSRSSEDSGRCVLLASEPWLNLNNRLHCPKSPARTRSVLVALQLVLCLFKGSGEHPTWLMNVISCCGLCAEVQMQGRLPATQPPAHSDEDLVVQHYCLWDVPPCPPNASNTCILKDAFILASPQPLLSWIHNLFGLEPISF